MKTPAAIFSSGEQERSISSNVLSSIAGNKFSSRFIKTLYSAFGGQIETLLPTQESYAQHRYYLTSSKGAISSIQDLSQPTFRTIDVASATFIPTSLL